MNVGKRLRQKDEVVNKKADGGEKETKVGDDPFVQITVEFLGEEIIGGRGNGVGENQAISQEMFGVGIGLQGDNDGTEEDDEQPKELVFVFTLAKENNAADDNEDGVNDADEVGFDGGSADKTLVQEGQREEDTDKLDEKDFD